jgi:hypothetical protein
MVFLLFILLLWAPGRMALAEGPPTCRLSTAGELLAARAQLAEAIIGDKWYPKEPHPLRRDVPFQPKYAFGDLGMCLQRVKKLSAGNDFLKGCFQRIQDFSESYAGAREGWSPLLRGDYAKNVPDAHHDLPASLQSPELFRLLHSPKEGESSTDLKGVLGYLKRVNKERAAVGEEPLLATWFNGYVNATDGAEGDRLLVVAPKKVPGGKIYQYINFTTLAPAQEEQFKRYHNSPEQIAVVSTFVPDDPKARGKTYFLDARRDYKSDPPGYVNAKEYAKANPKSAMNCVECHAARPNAVFPTYPKTPLAGDIKEVNSVLEKITASRPEAPQFRGDVFRQGLFLPDQGDIPADFFKECAGSAAAAKRVHGAFTCRNCHDGESQHRLNLGRDADSFDHHFGHYLRSGLMPPGEGKNLMASDREALLECVKSFGNFDTVKRYLTLGAETCDAGAGADRPQTEESLDGRTH